MSTPDEQPNEQARSEQTPSGTATWALAFGALAFIGILGLAPVSLVVGPLAIVIGIVARVQIDRSDGKLTGKPAAFLGLLLGLIGLTMAPVAMRGHDHTYCHRRAREATLRGNLHEIRTAVGHFHDDCDCYPARLEDLVATKPPASGVGEHGNSVAITPGAYQGPYLTAGGGFNGMGIPKNPFATSDAKLANHWTYRNCTVKPTVPAEGKTFDGTPYQEL